MSALPPSVPMVKTPNNGFHLYFRQPPGEPLGNGRGTLPAGCDVRGVGGFVIGPGAVLPDGRGWIRVANRPPVTQPAQLGWIESILRRRPSRRVRIIRLERLPISAAAPMPNRRCTKSRSNSPSQGKGRGTSASTRRPFGSAPWRRAAGSPKPRSGTRYIVRARPMGCSKTTVAPHFSARWKAGSATVARFRTET